MSDALTSWPVTFIALCLAIIGVQMLRRRLEERRRAARAAELRLVVSLVRAVQQGIAERNKAGEGCGDE